MIVTFRFTILLMYNVVIINKLLLSLKSLFQGVSLEFVNVLYIN